MMKQLFFVLFLATVVLMVSASSEVADDKPAKPADKAAAAVGGAKPEGNGASMTTLTTASLIGLGFNILMNFWQ